MIPRWSRTLRRYSIDLDSRTLTIQLADGALLSDRLPADLAFPGVDTRRVAVDLVDRELVLSLRSGTELTLELGCVDAPADRRPVVYLDQLHWVALAQQLWATERVAEHNREPAVRLIELAQARQVILPFSAGHLSEATWGRRRTNFVDTVFSLSRGWLMRSPFHVRQDELVAALSGEPPRARDVITLEPETAFVEAVEMPPGPADFPVDLQDLHRRLTAVSALYAAMLDDEQLDATEAREKTQRWADAHHALALQAREQGLSREQTRERMQAALLADLRDEVAAAAFAAQFDTPRIGAWLLNEFPGELRRMPYLGHLSEVLYERLRNPDDKWERNDFIDLHFLSCAAGYADVVVGEKKTSELLRRASRRREGGAYITRTLSDAVDYLDGRL